MTNYKKLFKFIISIFILFSFSLNIFLLTEIQGKSILTDNKSKNIIKDNIVENQNFYLKLVEDINNKFIMKDYNEILNENNYYLCLPLESKEIDLPSRQKMFVYKNPYKKCIIFLSITYSKYNSKDNNEWTASYDYAPLIFNNNIGEYKDSYSSAYPKIQIASNSFNYDGCHISILSFSDDKNINNEPSYVAAEELTSFSNTLLKFINERMDKNE